MSDFVKCAFVHEVNNLLTVILAHTDLLTTEYAASLPARKHLQAIRSAAQRIANTVYCEECALYEVLRKTEDHAQDRKREAASAAAD